MSPPPGARGMLYAGLLLAVLGGYLNWTRISYNWDLLGYVGAALRLGGASKEEVHRRSYAAVRAAVSDSTYRLLTEVNAYRRAVAADPEAFDQQLPFYASKPAYVWLLGLADRAGLSPVSASVTLSRLAYLALGLSVWWWCQTMVGAAWACGIAALVMAVPFLMYLARLSTPDGLSVLITANAVLLTVERRKVWWGYGLLLLALAVRLDNILWVPLIAAFLMIHEPRRRVAVAGWVAAAALLYAAVHYWTGFYGWRQLLYVNFVERLAYPANEPHAVMAWTDYLMLLVRQSHPVRLPDYFTLFALLGALTLWVRTTLFGWRDRWTHLVVMCLAFIAMHHVIYPLLERVLVAGYVGLLLALIRTLRDVTARPAAAGKEWPVSLP